MGFIDGNINVAATCQKCGRVSISRLSIFELKNDKEVKLSCSCGSLNATINSKKLKNINFKINCMNCGKSHNYKYKYKQLVKGTYVNCIESGIDIAMIGNSEDVSKYIQEVEKDTLDMIYNENFGLFFTDYSIMKECIERLQWLRENGRVNCDCGAENVVTEIFPDRIELRCVRCNSTKVIYAETRDDLNNFYCKNKINMHKYEFDFIDAIKNKE